MVITLFKNFALQFKNNFLRKAIGRLFIFLFFNIFKELNGVSNLCILEKFCNTIL